MTLSKSWMLHYVQHEHLIALLLHSKWWCVREYLIWNFCRTSISALTNEMIECFHGICTSDMASSKRNRSNRVCTHHASQAFSLLDWSGVCVCAWWNSLWKNWKRLNLWSVLCYIWQCDWLLMWIRLASPPFSAWKHVFFRSNSVLEWESGMCGQHSTLSSVNKRPSCLLHTKLISFSGHLFVQIPHFYDVMNRVRVGTYLSIFYSSILMVMLTFAPGVSDADYPAYQTSITTAMWAGQLPVFALGMILATLRMRYFHITVVGRFRCDVTYHTLYFIFKGGA